MRSAILKFIIAIILTSCTLLGKKTEIDYTGFVDKEFKITGYTKEIDLRDTLGIVSLKIPLRLDTFYKWHRTSDCLPCGWMQYRFADKKYPQFAEGGFYWTVVPDSVYQLTIRHKPIKEIPDTITLKPLSEKNKNDYWYHQTNSVSYSDSIGYLFKEFKLINQRPFIISAFTTTDGYLTESQTLFIIAATTLKNRELFFIGECSAKDTTGFVDSMYKSFLSIRIKENP